MNIQKISEKIWEIIKWHKRYVLAAVVLLVFVVRWYFSWSTTTTAVTQTYSVTSGSIENTLKLIWTTKITNMQTLVFWAEGKVKAIYVKEGDKVKAGQLLAEIDKKSLSISLSQQALSIQNARINYDKMINQYTAADIVKAQNDVSGAQSKLDIAKQALQDLKGNVWNILQNTSSYVQTNTLDAKSVANDSSDIMENVDKIFSFTSRNDTYLNSYNKTFIQATTSVYYTTAQTYFNNATTAVGLLNTQFSNLSSSITTTRQSIQALQDQEKTLLNTLSTMIDNCINALNNAMIGDGAIPQSQINSRLSTLNSANSKILSHLSSVNTNIQNFNNTSTDIQTKQNEVNTDDAQLQLYQQTLQDIQNWPNANDRILQSNSIKQSQLSYEQTSQQLDNYQIIAPFDGTIDTIWFKVGDTVSSNAGTSANGITVSNPDAYEVNTLIDQIDIVKVSPWQLVEITFDAYPGYFITWIIASIDPTPITSAGVVSYNATINLKQTEGKKIYDSMSANVKVIIDHKDNILVIPTIAIQTSGDNSYVWTQQGTKYISVGITDGIQTEILSWLQEGDIFYAHAYKVQSAAKSTNIFQQGKSSGTWSSWKANTNQSFRMLNGAWGGGPWGN